MAYRGSEINVRRTGRFIYSAYVTEIDDGLPDEPCPVHGFDPPRTDFGTLLVDGIPWHKASLDAIRGCICGVQTGADMVSGPYCGMTHSRAWRKAYRELQKSGGSL